MSNGCRSNREGQIVSADVELDALIRRIQEKIRDRYEAMIEVLRRRAQDELDRKEKEERT